MAICPPNKAISRILAALGLENVRSLKISAEVNSAVAVVTEQYVTGTQMDDLATALETKEWVLVPKDAGRWVSVDERLPEEYERVIGWRAGLVRAGEVWRSESGGWLCGDCEPAGGITHWTPLPEPPEVK